MIKDANVRIIASPSKRWHNSCDLAKRRGAGDLQDQITAGVSGRGGGDECNFARRDGPAVQTLHVRGLSREDALDNGYGGGAAQWRSPEEHSDPRRRKNAGLGADAR